ncbi:MAG: hypothetical protein ACYSUB_22645 [Planctomycetota bacterium]|jgi:hypothetical protein
MCKIAKSFSEVTARWMEGCLGNRFSDIMGTIRNLRIVKQSEGPLSQRAIIKIDYKNKNKQLPDSLFISKFNETWKLGYKETVLFTMTIICGISFF